MSVVFGCLTPHPPILAPFVGGASSRELAATREAMERLSERIARISPDALVIISPHTPSLADAIGVNVSPLLGGSFSRFGAPNPQYRFETDLDLARAILDEGCSLGADMLEVEVGDENAGFPGQGLDYGVLVPLHYLVARKQVPIVSLAVMVSAHRPHYLVGQAVSAAAGALGRKVVFVASGDLSHKLTPDAPAGFSPEGPLFDNFVCDAFARGDFRGLMEMDTEFAERAAECGLRSMIALAGCFDGSAVRTEILSYEGPFGVGYLVAAVEPEGPDSGRRFYEEEAEEMEGVEEPLAIMAPGAKERDPPPVRLARRALEAFLRKENRPNWAELDGEPPFSGRAGVFVCLKIDGELRGCVGTVKPTQDTLAEEIANAAVGAATCDPRFPPVTPQEIDRLAVSVDILGAPEPVADVSELDPKRFGVIVAGRGRQGVLLPDLAGVDSVEAQLAIARQKAGLGRAEPVEILRFAVDRYEGKTPAKDVFC